MCKIILVQYYCITDDTERKNYKAKQHSLENRDRDVQIYKSREVEGYMVVYRYRGRESDGRRDFVIERKARECKSIRRYRSALSLFFL